jgi:hypothetical protein
MRHESSGTGKRETFLVLALNRQDVVLHVGFLVLLLGLGVAVADDGDEDTTWDGLVTVEQSKVAAAFKDPAADFSAFRRVSILEPHVAFRSNWKRDQNRSRLQNIRASDVERIQRDISSLFMDVFVERLEAAGYDVVNYADEDVLVLRPAIIDLDISAPDVQRSGRSRTYTGATGAATLFIELFDSLSGDLMGRAVDRRVGGRGRGFAINANRVTNRADARREFRVWADALIAFLDQHYLKARVE